MLKKAWKGFIWFLAVLVILMTVLLAGVRLVGLQAYPVLEDTMAPMYPAGTLVYVKEADHRQLKTNDVITYMVSQEEIRTHRIVGIVPDETDSAVLRYRTKGDQSNTEDPVLVHYRNILGVPVMGIPFLGYAANLVQNPVAAGIGALIVLLAVLTSLLGGRKKRSYSGKYLRK